MLKESEIINIAVGLANSDNGTPVLFGMDKIVKFAKEIMKKDNE